MVSYLEVTDVRYAPYVIGLPNDFTCWHFAKTFPGNDRLHLAFITARSRLGDAYATTELEKMLLGIPEKVKRSRRARLAALKRKLRRTSYS